MRPVLPVLACLAAIAAAPPGDDADHRFRRLADEEYAWRLGQYAIDEDAPDRAARAHLPDVSPAAQAVRQARWGATLRALDAIAPDALSAENRVNYAVYRGQIEALVAQQRFRDWEMPANSDSSFWSDLAGGFADAPLRDEAAYRATLNRLGEVPRYFDQQIANMTAGEARGFTPPRVTLEGRDGSIAAVAGAKRAEDTAFWKPFRVMPASIPAAVQERLRGEARAAIMGRVVPAYATLLAFWRDTYVPRANPALAAEARPDGAAWYRAKIREFTTLDLAPEQIHAIGLKEVAGIRAEMDAVMREVGFGGDLPAFLAFLRADSRFYARTPQALLDRAAWIAKRFDGKAATWFGRLPRARFAIVPVPDAIAPFYTAGRGGPGVYLVNTWNLPSRPLYQLPALTLHESAPGHAFQIPLAQEHRDQPAFRRRGYISAYGEGWALYCERLGDEMGMYETPYERFGMLSYQMWRAARLVIDTGVHHDGWSRERALAYLRDNTALSEHEVTTEVDRYISWPGQALAYKLAR